jgi:hypothetical protein
MSKNFATRMAALQVTQPLPACSSLLYWKWTGKTIFMPSTKAVLLIFLVVSQKKFPLHHQTVTDKTFEIVQQHWFPTKSAIDQILFICFLAVNFILECRNRCFEPLRSVFQSHLLNPNTFHGIRHIRFVLHFTLSSVHLQRRIQCH